MKKLAVKVLVIAMILTIAATAAALGARTAVVDVYIDGQRVEFNIEDHPPIFMGPGERTLVPIRALFEALGYDVHWYDYTERVNLVRGPDEVVVNINSNIITINGDFMPLGFPAQIFGERTLMPVYALLNRIGHPVQWDAAARALHIRSLLGRESWDLIPGSLAAQIAPPEANEQIAIIHTNFGEIYLRLFPEFAPLAVENFITLAEEGFYDGLIFHRVIDGFLIQGGDPTGTGTGGESIWRAPFGNETSPNLRHIPGALSMANRGTTREISNNSQFFIVHGEDLYYDFVPIFEQSMELRYALAEDGYHTLGELFPSEFEFINHYLEYGGWPHLDFLHTVFGQVFAGMDVVEAIAGVPTDENDRPLVDVVIERIEILEFGN